MKKISTFGTALLFIILFGTQRNLLAQVVTYQMQPGVFTLNCSATNNFYDTGGSGGSSACPGISALNYQVNLNITETFNATAGQVINLDFSALGPNTFGLGTGDVLTVYDGPTTASPILGTWTNTTTTPGNITGIATSMTFMFISDPNAATTCKGWAIRMNCVVNGNSFTCNLLQPICPGDSSLVSWLAGSAITFNAGNVFTAQLSDANGTFAAPLNVGSVSSTASSGTIGIFAPANLTPGTHYRVRVKSSNPPMASTNNGFNILVTAPVTYYQDADLDGFGNAVVSVSSCTGPPTGYVSDQTDCNDGNATIYPTAPDICNNIDDNCNGIIDENAITATISPSGLIQICAGTVVYFTANTSAGITYQWVKNVSNIAGATNSTYHTHKKGKYHVNETNSFGCTSSSAIGNIKIVCRQENTPQQEETGEPSISLFPNPTDGNLTLIMPDRNESATLIICNELGTVVLTKQIPAHTISLYLSLDAQWQSGIYFARVISESATDAAQFILMR